MAGALGAFVALVYSLIGVQLFRNLRSGMDLAIFDQGVRGLSRFQAPVSAMKSPGMNLWGDHFHPILILAAPFYWIWDDPRMLLIVQAIAIGLTCSILCATAWRRLGAAHWAVVVALTLALATSLGVQYGAVFDFHEVALGMPLLALALSALLERRWMSFAGWSILILGVKEDAGMIVIGLAMVAFVYGRRRLAVVLTALSGLWMLLAIKVFIPALSPVHAWPYSGNVHGVGGSISSVITAFIRDGGLTIAVLWMLLAFACLPLGSWISLAFLPYLATRAIGANESYWRIYNHYNLLPCVIFAFAALDALTRVRWTRACALIMAGVAALSVVFGPVVNQATHGVTDERRDDATRAISAIPDGASVAADAYLTPHLTKHHPITQQVREHVPGATQPYTDDLGRPVVGDYILLDYATHSNGGDPAWVPTAVAAFEGRGFTEVYRAGDFVVLQRGH